MDLDIENLGWIKVDDPMNTGPGSTRVHAHDFINPKFERVAVGERCQNPAGSRYLER